MNKKVKIGLIVFSILCVVAIVISCIFLSSRNYTVTFDSNGGTTIEEQTVKKNDKVIKPLDPTRDGYEFDGWYLNNEKYYFDEKVTKNITLIAKWRKDNNKEKVTITFDTDGGSKIESQTIKKGDKLTKPTDPIKDGYIFDKWLLNNNEFDFDVEINSNITLKASYKKLDEGMITVTFNSNGGSSISTISVKVGETIKQPSNSIRNGYKFLGWYLNNKKFDFSTKIEDNITLVAKWEKVKTNNQQTSNNQTQNNNTQYQQPEIIKYVVTFNSNGGSNVGSQTVTSGGYATQPQNPTRDGYEFLNWTLNGGAYNFNTAVTNNITLVANWKKIEIPDVYTVKLDLIDGDVNSTERKAIVYKNNEVITVQQILDGSGNVLGKHITSLDAVRVNKAQYDLSSTIKVKLSDESIVDASKN